MDSAFEIVHHHIGGNPAKVGEHAALDPDKRGKLLIEHELAEEIRAKRQHPQEKLRKGLMATDRIGEKKTVTEIDLGFFRRLVIQPGSSLDRVMPAHSPSPETPAKTSRRRPRGPPRAGSV